MEPINLSTFTQQAFGQITGITGIASSPPTEGNFKNFLLEALDTVNNLQQDADSAVKDMFTGGDVTTAEVLTAVQKADMSFRLMMQIRNKLVQAYQEIQQVRI